VLPNLLQGLLTLVSRAPVLPLKRIQSGHADIDR